MLPLVEGAIDLLMIVYGCMMNEMSCFQVALLMRSKRYGRQRDSFLLRRSWWGAGVVMGYPFLRVLTLRPGPQEEMNQGPTVRESSLNFFQHSIRSFVQLFVQYISYSGQGILD